MSFSVRKIKHHLKLGFYPKLLLIALMMLELTSCGETAPSDNGISQTPELQTGCEINEDNLDNFVSREIPEDIDCLRKNLELFVRVVTPDSPETTGQLSQTALERYIAIREPQLADILKYTPLFFNLSHLIFGDKLGYLSKDNIAPLALAAIEINRELVLAYPILKDKPKEEIFKIHRKKSEILIKSATRIANSIEKLFKAAPPKEKPISVLETIEVFKTASNKETVEKIKSLTFIKRMLSGGEVNSISQVELRQIIGLFPQFAKLGFDILQFNEIVFDNEFQRYKFFNEVVVTLEEMLFFKNNSSAVLFTTQELQNALLKFESDIGVEDIKSYFSLIPEIKTVFGDSADVNFSRKDINRFLSHIKNLITYGEAFVDSYFAKQENQYGVKSNQALLESNTPIITDLLIENVRYQKQFKDFVRIAKNYRFFRGTNPIPYYGVDYRRNLNGMIEAVAIEYLYNEFATYYENLYPCRDEMFIRLRPFADPKICKKNKAGQCIEDLRCKNGEDYLQTLSQGQIEFIIEKLSDALIKLDLTSKQMEYSTAETAMLMNDLFQYQSNSNALIDKYEIAEFGGQIISAISMKKNIISAVKDLCSDHVYELDNGYTVYGANCLRENFLDVLYTKFEKKGKRPGDLPETFQYSTYLSSLVNYLKPSTSPKVTFVNKVEQFTNTCYGYFLKPSDETLVPVDEVLYEGDMIGIFGGLFNIESTLTRFDTDPIDNKLSGPEIEVAFQHFQVAVQGLLADSITGKFQNVIIKIIDLLGPEEIAKRIFYYMLKYREVPTVTSFDKAKKLAGHLLNRNYDKDVTVDRITIAAVLSGIKSSSKNKASEYQLSYICNKKPFPLPPLR